MNDRKELVDERNRIQGEFNMANMVWLSYSPYFPSHPLKTFLNVVLHEKLAALCN
jgi:hypothetical protein